jgi:hypothetical protein
VLLLHLEHFCHFPSSHHYLGLFFFLHVILHPHSHGHLIPKVLKASSIDEEEILKLDDDHLMPARAVLQWQPAKGKDIPTMNT